MKKDFLRFNDIEFDLAVVGGGIHGAILTYEAAKAGYKVALVEKGDFGHSTSANSLKIIHGGIRYLQHGDFKRMRESIISRRAMMQFAPHLVKPLACLMPTYGHGMKGRELMRIAFRVYDLISFDRNKGLPAASCLPNGGAISSSEMKWVAPGIKDEGLTGGAVWYDAIAENTERLILEYVKAAVCCGAVVANYVRATKVLELDGKAYGLKLEDQQRRLKTTLMCRAVVSAAGPWLGELGPVQGDKGTQLWATAINIVVRRRLFKKYAVGLEGYTDFTDKDALIKRGKRLFFFVPWRNEYTMIGTNYAPYQGPVDAFRVSREQVGLMLDDINKIYPAAGLTLADVSYFHGGLLPMDGLGGKGADTVQLDKSSRIIAHRQQGGPAGLYSIKGVKYTTAPDIAHKVLGLLHKDGYLPSIKKGAYTGRAPRRFDFGGLAKRLGSTRYDELVAYLQQRYGEGWRSVLSYLWQDRCMIADNPLYIVEKPPLLLAELLYFMHEEMAVNLVDVVLRRSDIGSGGCPAPEVLQQLAAAMGAELGWSKDEEQAQVAEVMAHYAILNDRN
jgi:glycerol-3-phosphate dehydrogenase